MGPRRILQRPSPFATNIRRCGLPSQLHLRGNKPRGPEFRRSAGRKARSWVRRSGL